MSIISVAAVDMAGRERPPVMAAKAEANACAKVPGPVVGAMALAGVAAAVELEMPGAMVRAAMSGRLMVAVAGMMVAAVEGTELAMESAMWPCMAVALVLWVALAEACAGGLLQKISSA